MGLILIQSTAGNREPTVCLGQLSLLPSTDNVKTV